MSAVDLKSKIPKTIKEAFEITGFCVDKTCANSDLIRALSAMEVAGLVHRLYISSHKDLTRVVNPETLYSLYGKPSSELYVLKDDDSGRRVDFSSDAKSGVKSIHLGPYNFTSDNIGNTALSFGRGPGISVSEISHGDSNNSVLVFCHSILDYYPHSETGGVLGHYRKTTCIYSPQDSLIIKEGLGTDRDLREKYRADLFRVSSAITPTHTHEVEISKISVANGKPRLIRSVLKEDGKTARMHAMPADKLFTKLGERATVDVTKRMVLSALNK